MCFGQSNSVSNLPDQDEVEQKGERGISKKRCLGRENEFVGLKSFLNMSVVKKSIFEGERSWLVSYSSFNGEQS